MYKIFVFYENIPTFYGNWFESGFTQLNVLQWENFEISQVGEALEEDLSSGGVFRGTQLLAYQYIFHLLK